MICGAANNQLAEDRHGDQLHERGILYAPDYVVNAGGILNISAELGEGGYDEGRAEKIVRTVGPNLEAVFAMARQKGITTARAARARAEEVLAEEGQRRDSARA